MTQLLSPLTSTPYPSTSSNAISDLLEVPDAVLWIEKYVNLRFASTAARDAAIPVPEDGMQCYVTGTPKQVFVYNAATSAWEIIWQSAGFTAWTPTVSAGLTVGNGTWGGTGYMVDRKLCTATFAFTMGSTSAVTGAVVLLFPVPIATSYIATQNCGAASVTDVSAGSAGRFATTCHVVSTATSGFGSFTFGGSASGSQLTTTVPMTWAVTDVLSATIQFQTT